MAGKRRLIKAGALLGLLLIVVGVIALLLLPQLLNYTFNRELTNRGYEDSKIEIRHADHKQLSVEYLTLNGEGWSLELKESHVDYSLPTLFSSQEIQFAKIDSLTLTINTAELPSSDDPLTIEILKSIPIQETRIYNGLVNLVTESGTYQFYWKGVLNITEDDKLSFILYELKVHGSSPEGDKLLELPSVSHDKLIELEIAMDGTTAAIKWHYPSVNINGPQWQITEGSSSGDLVFDGLELKGVPLAPTPELFSQFIQAAHGYINTTINEIVVAETSAQWISSEFEINPEPDANTRSTLSVNAGILTVAGHSFEQAILQLGNRGNHNHLETEGLITFLFEGMDGQLTFNHQASNLFGNLSLNGQYKLAPLNFAYSDLPGQYLPGFEDLVFSGTVSGNGTYQHSTELTDATSTLTLSKGSISVPSNNLELTGIQATSNIASFVELHSEPGSSEASIDLIQLGDLAFTDTQLLFDLLDSKTLRLTSGNTGLFDGTLQLSPSTFEFNPTQVDTSIAFEQLSLKAIVDGMDLFDGTMEGAVSGHLPIRFKNGRFETSSGFLELTEGIPAKLNYNTEGLFTPKEEEDKGFLASIGDKIMEKLKLAPENVVEDALSDLTLHELRIDLFPENSPDTPARIHLAGEGVTGNTVVPMILDTNINGTTDELLQFLLRIHSLGTPSF